MPAPKNVQSYPSAFFKLLDYAKSGTTSDLEVQVETFGKAARARNLWAGFARALRRESDAKTIARDKDAAAYWAAMADLADAWMIRVRGPSGRTTINKKAGESYSDGPAWIIFHKRGMDPWELALEGEVDAALHAQAHRAERPVERPTTPAPRPDLPEHDRPILSIDDIFGEGGIYDERPRARDDGEDEPREA